VRLREGGLGISPEQQTAGNGQLAVTRKTPSYEKALRIVRAGRDRILKKKLLVDEIRRYPGLPVLVGSLTFVKDELLTLRERQTPGLIANTKERYVFPVRMDDALRGLHVDDEQMVFFPVSVDACNETTPGSNRWSREVDRSLHQRIASPWVGIGALHHPVPKPHDQRATLRVPEADECVGQSNPVP
jgi:hypothetical protein